MKSKDMFDSLGVIEREKGVPMDVVFDKISKAISTACRNNYDGNEDVFVNVDKKKNIFEVYLNKTVVDNVTKPGCEILFEDAVKIDPNTKLGEKVSIKLNTKDFGRIAVQTAKTILKQGIKDGETDIILKKFGNKRGETVSAIVEKIDPKTKTDPKTKNRPKNKKPALQTVSFQMSISNLKWNGTACRAGFLFLLIPVWREYPCFLSGGSVQVLYLFKITGSKRFKKQGAC